MSKFSFLFFCRLSYCNNGYYVIRINLLFAFHSFFLLLSLFVLHSDMLIGHDHSLTRSIQEYNGNVKHIGGLLVLFLNSWSKPSKPKVNHGTLTQIRYAGAPAFLISKKTLIKIGGNPYTSCRLYRPKKCPDGEAANEWFWNKLKSNKMSLLSNINQSYSVQHLANSQSLIFGKQLGW